MTEFRSADVNAKNNPGWTPLHMAIAKGHKDVAELLLANKADVNAKCNSGSLPLHIVAANCDRKDIAELLLAHGGAGVNDTGYNNRLFSKVSG